YGSLGGQVCVTVIDMGNTSVKGVVDDLALLLPGGGVAEVLPQAEGDQRQLQPTPSAVAHRHVVVSVLGWCVHAPRLRRGWGDCRRAGLRAGAVPHSWLPRCEAGAMLGC